MEAHTPLAKIALTRTGQCTRCGLCCGGCGFYKAPDCTIYDIRGQGCRNFPPHPYERLPTCGFHFLGPDGKEVLGYKDHSTLERYAPVQEND